MNKQIIKGNLLKSTADYFCHCVNCRGVFNAGIAGQIRNKYPNVYDAYINYIDEIRDRETDSFTPYDVLSQYQIVPINKQQSIVNMFCQSFYGKSGIRYVSYDAVEIAFRCFFKEIIAKHENVTVAVPLGFGSGLAGGNQDIITTIIDTTLKNCYNNELITLEYYYI